LTGPQFTLTVTLDADNKPRIILEDMLHGLEALNVKVTTSETSTSMDEAEASAPLPGEEPLVLRIPSPARMQRMRDDENPMDMSTEETVLEPITETQTNVDARFPAGTSVLTFPNGASKPGLHPLSHEDMLLAYGGDPSHIQVKSETASETSSVAHTTSESSEAREIKRLIKGKFPSHKVSFGRGIVIGKAKIYALKRTIEGQHKIQLFLAGRASNKMMRNPLDVRQGDIIELSGTAGPVAVTQEQDDVRRSNQAILQEVYRCITSVISM
jgi:hypothetical protein